MTEGKIIDDVYFDPSNPGSFGGANRLLLALKDSGVKEIDGEALTPKAVRNWLRKKDTYTLHRKVFFKYPRNKTIVGGLHQQWQLDLVDVQSLASYNEGNRYLLVCIDVFSRQAFVEPSKSKSGENITRAFERVLNRAQVRPESVQTDKGSEFYNSQFQAFLKQRDIHLFSTHNETKAAMVERLNRTLKDRMWRYFTHAGNYRYLDILQPLVLSYNNSIHRSIGMKPSQVTYNNQSEVWHKQYGDTSWGTKSAKRFRFKIGDQVRVSKAKMTFRKGYKPGWSDEIYFIHSRFPHKSQPVYELRDYNEEVVKGNFYEKELQKVVKGKEDFFSVDTVLKTRGKGAKKEFFVSWKGYDHTHNSWVKAVDFQDKPAA